MLLVYQKSCLLEETILHKESVFVTPMEKDDISDKAVSRLEGTTITLNDGDSSSLMASAPRAATAKPKLEKTSPFFWWNENNMKMLWQIEDFPEMPPMELFQEEKITEKPKQERDEKFQEITAKVKALVRDMHGNDIEGQLRACDKVLFLVALSFVTLNKIVEQKSKDFTVKIGNRNERVWPRWVRRAKHLQKELFVLRVQIKVARDLKAEILARNKEMPHMECALCGTTFVNRVSSFSRYTFCKECRCYVCSKCDCKQYHLDFQKQLWVCIEQDERDEETRKKTQKTSKNRKRKERRKRRKKATKLRADEIAKIVSPQQNINNGNQHTVQTQSKSSSENRDDSTDCCKDVKQERRDEANDTCVDFVQYLQATGSIVAVADLMDKLESRGIDLDKGCIQSHEVLELLKRQKAIYLS